MKINNLTAKQEEMLPRYVEMGINIGLATGSDMDEELIRKLTDAHRVASGVAAAKNFMVFDSPMDAIKNIPGLTAYNALYGQHDISWLILYLYFRVECGLIEETQAVVNLLELTKHVGWMWMSGDTTVVTRKPDEIHMRETGSKAGHLPLKVLHNPEGMAIRYRNGDGFYCLDGLAVPSHYITEPYDIKKVLAETNVEIRNSLLKLGGPDVLEKYCNKRVIHTDTLEQGGEYELYTIELNEVTRTYLKGTCPSKGQAFNEAVPPTVTTVKAALRWREWGHVALPSEYILPQVRT